MSAIRAGGALTSMGQREGSIPSRVYTRVKTTMLTMGAARPAQLLGVQPCEFCGRGSASRARPVRQAYKQ